MSFPNARLGLDKETNDDMEDFSPTWLQRAWFWLSVISPVLIILAIVIILSSNARDNLIDFWVSLLSEY